MAAGTGALGHRSRRQCCSRSIAPEPHDAIRADTAYVMTEPAARRRPARHRRPRRRRSTGRSAGKTGTMDDYTDAWFVGFDPDDHASACGSATTRRSRSATARPAPPRRCRSGSRSCGPGSSGRDRRRRPTFDPPGNIVFVAGRPATPASRSDDGTSPTITEAFIAGTAAEPLAAQSGQTPALSASSSPCRRLAERAARLLHQVGLDEAVEVAVEHAVDVADLASSCGGP